MVSVQERITSIYYEDLPPLRRKVLDRILVGYSIKRIATDVEFSKRTDPIACVNSHLSQIYKDFQEFLEDVDRESKRSHLIILFYSEAPAIVAKIRIELASPFPQTGWASQFGELVNEYRYELHRVTKEEIPILQGLGRKYFKAQDHLPTKLLEGWYERDPNSFRKMKNKNGRIAGFFVVLFLKFETFKKFAKGEILEKEILASKLISAKDKQKPEENYLYISVVVGEDGDMAVNTCILLCLARYLDSLREFRRIEKLYATAATEQGRDLMQTFGFKLHTPARARKDCEDFFESDLTEIGSDLSEELIQTLRPFQRYARSIDFGDGEDWQPIYPYMGTSAP